RHNKGATHRTQRDDEETEEAEGQARQTAPEGTEGTPPLEENRQARVPQGVPRASTADRGPERTDQVGQDRAEHRTGDPPRGMGRQATAGRLREAGAADRRSAAPHGHADAESQRNPGRGKST